MGKKKRDLLLIAAILAAAAIGFFANSLARQKPASRVEVSVDGEITETFDLNKDTDTIIHGFKGGTNHLIIKDGVVWVSEASCPDKICVNQGRITSNGQVIVCLPNRMIVKVVAPE